MKLTPHEVRYVVRQSVPLIKEFIIAPLEELKTEFELNFPKEQGERILAHKYLHLDQINNFPFDAQNQEEIDDFYNSLVTFPSDEDVNAVLTFSNDFFQKMSDEMCANFEHFMTYFQVILSNVAEARLIEQSA